MVDRIEMTEEMIRMRLRYFFVAWFLQANNIRFRLQKS